MKTGIVSDTHGCLETWKHIYAEYLSDCDIIIHAGDILYHGPRNPVPGEYNPRDLAAALNQCPIPLIAVRGNCDSEVDQMVLDVPIQSPFAHVYVDGMNILVNHGHLMDEKERESLLHTYRVDLLITGHTHAGCIKRSGKALLLNPGSPGMTKREDGLGTIALLEEGRLQLLDVSSGSILEEESL